MPAGPRPAAPPTLQEKVAFLGDPAAYGPSAGPVARRETHMSWLFFVGETVLKLKKPVRLPYLDFSTLAQREAACRAEYALNQALAPGVYDGVVPLVLRDGRLALGGEGEVTDWLVRMRRLDQSRTLEARLPAGDLSRRELDDLAGVLTRFYRRARRVHAPPVRRLADWRAAVTYNGRILLDPRLGLPAGRVRAVLAAQRRFLRVRAELLGAAERWRVIDAHGDLRPEHIWMGPPIRLIDRLEFNPRLRAVDPLDELAFLDLETDRFGAPEVGAHVRRRVTAALGRRDPPELHLFYRSYRAMLRARLAIAHLLEPDPRTPEKWPRQARAYLAIAVADARVLTVRLNRP